MWAELKFNKLKFNYKKINKFEKKLAEKMRSLAALFFITALLAGYIAGYSRMNISSGQFLKKRAMLYERNKKDAMAKLNYKIRYFSIANN